MNWMKGSAVSVMLMAGRSLCGEDLTQATMEAYASYLKHLICSLRGIVSDTGRGFHNGRYGATAKSSDHSSQPKRGTTMARDLRRHWCAFAHDSPMWPIKGQYECRKCGCRHVVPWAEQIKAERPALPLLQLQVDYEQ